MDDDDKDDVKHLIIISFPRSMQASSLISTDANDKLSTLRVPVNILEL